MNLKKCAKIVDEGLEIGRTKYQAPPRATPNKFLKIEMRGSLQKEELDNIGWNVEEFQPSGISLQKYTIGKDIVSLLEKLELHNGDCNYLK